MQCIRFYIQCLVQAYGIIFKSWIYWCKSVSYNRIQDSRLVYLQKTDSFHHNKQILLLVYILLQWTLQQLFPLPYKISEKYNQMEICKDWKYNWAGKVNVLVSALCSSEKKRHKNTMMMMPVINSRYYSVTLCMPTQKSTGLTSKEAYYN